jgi:hypothetical protein
VIPVVLGLAFMVTGCSLPHGPPEVTTVVVDGRSQSITGPTECIAQPGGGLLILANGKGHDRLRALLDRTGRLTLVKVSLRVGDTRGYSENSAEMSATRADGLYTISGSIPPNEGEVAAHQFQIQVTCTSEISANLPSPGIANMGGP